MKHNAAEIVEKLFDRNDFHRTYRDLKENDPESADLMMQVYMYFKKRLEFTSNENEAWNRLHWVINQGKASPLARNNIFKAAHALGMKLPSMFFAASETKSSGMHPQLEQEWGPMVKTAWGPTDFTEDKLDKAEEIVGNLKASPYVDRAYIADSWMDAADIVWVRIEIRPKIQDGARPGASTLRLKSEISKQVSRYRLQTDTFLSPKQNWPYRPDEFNLRALIDFYNKHPYIWEFRYRIEE